MSAVSVVTLLALPVPGLAQQKRPVTYTDLMQFRQVESPVLSRDGSWLAFTATPDRGDGEVKLHATQGGRAYSIERGSHPVFSRDGAWVAARVNPSLAEAEKAKASAAELHPGLALLRTSSGEITRIDSVLSFGFSADGRWLAYHRAEAPKNPAPPDSASADSTAAKVPKKESAGTPLVLRELETGRTLEIADVKAFALSEAAPYVAYAVAAPDSLRDGLYLRDLGAAAGAEEKLDVRPQGHYTHLTWHRDTPRLAFLAAVEDTAGKPGDAALWLWTPDGGARQAVSGADVPRDRVIPAKNEVRWSHDGERLFFGFKAKRSTDTTAAAQADTAAFDPYDLDVLLKERTVDVWHPDDPRIKTHEREAWKKEQDLTSAAVYHLAARRFVALGDSMLRVLPGTDGERAVLAVQDHPYRREATWTGPHADYYAVDLQSGGRTRIAERLPEGSGVTLSPGGRFVAYYQDGAWYLHDFAQGTGREVTAGLDVPFASEDHDAPRAAPGYGTGGWVGDEAVLIYDKFDVWYVPTGGGEPHRLTAGDGRAERRSFRVVRTDPKRRSYEPGERVLLSSYHDERKNFGFYEGTLGETGVRRLVEEDKKFTFTAKAEEAGTYLYTREAYDEFPDLWVADPDFEKRRKVTDVNPQMKELAWGSAELIEWTSLDGIPLQGIVIKPANYEEGRRYPVLTYYYELFSQLLHDFSQPAVNHRPSFPLYASDGYLIFLPDVRYEVGRPGFSAFKSVMPGVQKLVDLGLADSEALGLHGHSWSGYQTAFIVTQTDLFAAAVAGAPVSNMTSAYSGIRWGTGLARQFQYEATQSRIGASLWEQQDDYIANSPVFFADRINTPLLIIHGDVDGAVPWEQSIELYLACRRLGKPCTFLQYRGEDHHPAKYANKLDWAMRMKAFFDHHLKGEPSPEWLESGVPYQGE